jgi:hypothetical protein
MTFPVVNQFNSIEKWELVSSNNSSYVLPKGLIPDTDAYFPAIDSIPIHIPGSDNQYFTGDAKSQATNLKLLNGFFYANTEIQAYKKIQEIQEKLSTAIGLKRTEIDGVLPTWDLDTGYSKIVNFRPSARGVNLWYFDIVFALSVGNIATFVYNNEVITPIRDFLLTIPNPVFIYEIWRLTGLTDGQNPGSVTSANGSYNSDNLGNNSPTYKSSGINNVPYLDFNGTNQYMKISNLDLRNYSQLTILCVFRLKTSNLTILMEHTVNFNTSNHPSFLLDFNEVPNKTQSGVCMFSSLSSYRLYNNATLIGTVPHYMEQLLDLSGNSTLTYIDNDSSGSYYIAGQLSGNFIKDDLYIGSRAGNQFLGSMEIYMLSMFNHLLTQEERIKYVEYVNSVYGL